MAAYQKFLFKAILVGKINQFMERQNYQRLTGIRHEDRHALAFYNPYTAELVINISDKYGSYILENFSFEKLDKAIQQSILKQVSSITENLTINEFHTKSSSGKNLLVRYSIEDRKSITCPMLPNDGGYGAASVSPATGQMIAEKIKTIEETKIKTWPTLTVSSHSKAILIVKYNPTGKQGDYYVTNYSSYSDATKAIIRNAVTNAQKSHQASPHPHLHATTTITPSMTTAPLYSGGGGASALPSSRSAFFQSQQSQHFIADELQQQASASK